MTDIFQGINILPLIIAIILIVVLLFMLFYQINQRTNNSKKMAPKDQEQKVNNRDNFADKVINASALTIFVFGIIAILLDTDRTMDVFNSVLPMLGAWVGTVLAFYFGKDNFESGARNTSELVKRLSPDEILKSKPVKDSMIPIDDAVVLKLTKDESDYSLDADIVTNLFDNSNKNRLPVLDSIGKVKYILHRSMVDRFILNKLKDNAKLDSLTLKDFLDDPELRGVVCAFGTIRESFSLADAKRIIDLQPNCSDVFVLSKENKTVGWLTNNDILSHMKA